MNKTIRLNRHFFNRIIAFTFTMIIFAGCSDGSSGGSNNISVPTLPEGAEIDLSDNSITVATIVNSMKFGWNLGNTLDAHESPWNTNKGSVECDWGMKDTATQALFNKLYDSGIRTVRIPVSWHNHVDSSMNINSGWMNHVKEIVDMAYSKGLFVIINIHHDNYEGESLGSNPGFTLFNADKTQSLNYIGKIWQQISDTFKNYDGHLVFETINEPRVIGDDHEWGCNGSPEWGCSVCQQRFAIINALNQKAVDTIRASGGNNAKRVIMFPAYVAAPYAAIKGKQNGIFNIPTDSATNRLALSVHMYTPYNFAMEYPGSSTFTDSHRNDLAGHFTALNSEFISQGIPVVIGEMGATNKNNFSERQAWFSYYLGLCKQYNVAAVLWDNGLETNPNNGAESYGYMNRNASGGPDWFTSSQAAQLISTAVSARN